jgi:hypothetical protein
VDVSQPPREPGKPGASSFWQVLEARACFRSDSPGSVAALILVIALLVIIYLLFR